MSTGVTARPNGTPARSLSRTLARHIAQTQYEQLPESALRAAKRLMLDTLAVAWAGSNAAGCGEARQLVLEDGGRGESSVWVYGDRLPAGASAFLNSTFAAALDFDSLGRDAPTHVGIVMLPVALALAQREHAPGKAFLTALVTGCDLMYRMAASCEATGRPHKGWFYTSVHGGMASAAAGAHLLKLNEVETAHAMGLAYSQAAGTQQANIEPTLTKRMQAAFAARSGTFSALLAQRGITAPQEVFEGRYGLHNLYQEGNAERLLDGLGQRYENDEFSIKKYPSCGCNHAAIEGALRIANDYDLRPDDVERIEVEISPFMHRLVGSVFDPASGNAQAVAQFNIRYSIACAIVRREFGLAELDEAVIRDPVIGALAQRVEVIVDQDNSGTLAPMVLRVYSRQRGEIACRMEHAPGSLEAPLSGREIADKARACFMLGYRPLKVNRIDDLMERIDCVEQVPDMSSFFEGII